MSLPERTVSSPDVDQSSRPHGKKKSGRRKADVAAEKPKAAAPKARTRKVTQKVPEDNERLVIGRFKDALAKQKTADEANQLTLERLTRQKEPVVRRVKADQDEESIEVTQHIAEETRLDPSNAVAGFNYFCSQTTPEWFAVQVDQPDPGAASKVAYYLTSAQTGLSMYIDLPSGQQVLRQIEVFNPKKKVTVPSRKAGSTLEKTVTWENGTYVFFRTIMDSVLIKYLQPFFVDDSQFWFKRLRKKPVPPLMVEFVDGIILQQKYFIPKPVNQKMLEQVQEWLEKEETWTKEQVQAYDNGAEPRNEIMDDIEAQVQAEEEEAASSGEDPEAQARHQEQLRKAQMEEESRRELRVRLKSASQQDPGAWNVGVSELRRKKRAHTISGSKGGRGVFNRSKFGESVPERDQDGSGWRFLKTRHQQRQELPNDSGWYENPVPSRRQSEENVTRLTKPTTPAQSSVDSRGTRRATGAGRGSGPAAKSGWFPPTNDNLGLEEEDWMLPSNRTESNTQAKSSMGGRQTESGTSNAAASSSRAHVGSDRLRDRQSEGLEEADSPDEQWYKGQESTPAGDVGGYAEGWYDAAAAASKQYSRTQENGNDWYDGANGSGNATPSGGGWYEGPSKSGNAKQSSNEWYTGPADGGSPGAVSGFDTEAWDDWEQEIERQNAAEKFEPRGDPWLKPSSDPNDWSSWGFSTSDSATNAEGKAGESGASKGLDKELLSYQTEEVGQAEAAVRGDEALSPEPNSHPSKIRRAGKDSSGILDVSDASSEGTSKAQNSAEEPKQRKRSSSSSAFSGRVASRPLFARGKQVSASDAVPLSAGCQVLVGGGRFKGRQGKILQVRGGVVRVQMEGAEGPVEADMAAAHCTLARRRVFSQSNL